MRSEKPICALRRLSEASPALPLEQLQCSSDDGPVSSFQGRSSNASSFHASLLQAIDGVVSLALCIQVTAQVPQHFRPSETLATCDGSFSVNNK